jgi:murein L,D-transpeptidase YcbB/YkuD
VAWLLLVALAAGCVGPRTPPPSATDSRVVEALRHLPADGSRRAARSAWLRRFYAARDDRPAWVTRGGVHARADDLLAELDGASAHGLDPQRYGATLLREAVNRRRAGQVVDGAGLDVALSAAFLALADDLRRGAVDPATAIDSWQVSRPPTDLSGLLATAISLDRVGATLRQMAPGHPQYRRLQQALATTTADSAAALRANLERWRWLPRDLGSRYLLVRIADFEVDLVIDGRRETHRAIVGEPYRQTPQFASEVTGVSVHPSWYVPPRIADEELAPLLRADPQGLAARGFHVVGPCGTPVPADEASWPAGTPLSATYRLVQAPGGGNPLGRVKLVMENPFAVFLHDTPAAGLFDAEDRSRSHGCVRVEGVVDMVERLLPPVRRARFQRLLADGETGWVGLERPVPVYLLYWTVSVTPDGRLRRAEDLYGVDEPLLRALQRSPGALPWLRRLAQTGVARQTSYRNDSCAMSSVSFSGVVRERDCSPSPSSGPSRRCPSVASTG